MTGSDSHSDLALVCKHRTGGEFPHVSLSLVHVSARAFGTTADTWNKRTRPATSLMEEGGEVSGNGSSSIVELSLDSVLRKAAELEGTLREMAATRRNCSSVLSAKGVDRQEEASGTLTVREEAEQEPSGSERGAEGDIAAQWQKLTSYIVSLENELQYYKQLVEGFEQLALEERAKTAAAARDSPSQSEGSTSSSSCDGDSTGRQLDHLQENSALQQWDATLQGV